MIAFSGGVPRLKIYSNFGRKGFEVLIRLEYILEFLKIMVLLLI